MLRLVCCGALTNAALLITLFPEISSMLDIVLMGGALGVGNTVRWCGRKRGKNVCDGKDNGGPLSAVLFLHLIRNSAATTKQKYFTAA
jgi:hypothetical protein